MQWGPALAVAPQLALGTALRPGVARCVAATSLDWEGPHGRVCAVEIGMTGTKARSHSCLGMAHNGLCVFSCFERAILGTEGQNQQQLFLVLAL